MWPHNPLPITWLCRRLVRKRHPCLPLLLLTLVAFLLRVYKINRDPRVVWDETHFGRFASNYLAHTFYLDVHPPLAKLLITLMFRLLGYSGLFDFASGHAYPSNVPIRAMRIVQAAIGSLLVPSTYYLCRCLEMPLDASWLASVFVAFDNALVGISRIVVLDSMLLLANSLVVLALVRLLAFDKRSVAAWVIRLLVLGLALGVVCRASTINGSSAIANNSLVSLQAPGSSSHISVHYNYSFGGQGLSVGFAEHAPKYSMAQPLFVWKLKEEPRKQKQINVPGIAPIFSKFRLVSLFGGCELAINHAHYLQRVQPSKSMMHEYSLYCVTGKGTVWTIEHQLPTENHKIHNISKHAQPGFIKSMISYNRLMHEINGMLISDPDKYSIVESTPFSWPFLRLPMPMVEWSGNKIKVSWMLAAMVLPPNALTNERLSFVWYIQVAVVFLVILSSYFVAPMTYGIRSVSVDNGISNIFGWNTVHVHSCPADSMLKFLKKCFGNLCNGDLAKEFLYSCLSITSLMRMGERA
ncbi:Protein O-mannosyltransferase 2 [Coemansia umbellata]|uniref:Protein O-mannosyltransferase 2 n=1 Tax=Coemansia umbellata TaxID=1424467 RepID=A0ABQ8PNG3_9FUNG|nr:Protein O-mannosyltransferase 2 [Coemansia umbellata]